MIQNLYAIELEIPQGSTDAEISTFRQKRAKPISEEFYRWLTEKQAKIPPKSNLGKALCYVLERWSALTDYHNDGRLRIDNHACENLMRPFALGRKKRWGNKPSIK